MLHFQDVQKGGEKENLFLKMNKQFMFLFFEKDFLVTKSEISAKNLTIFLKSSLIILYNCSLFLCLFQNVKILYFTVYCTWIFIKDKNTNPPDSEKEHSFDSF